MKPTSSPKENREELTSIVRLLAECHSRICDIAEHDHMSKTGVDERLNDAAEELCLQITNIGDIIGRLLACDIMDGVEG